MIDTLLVHLRRYDAISEVEEQALRGAMSGVLEFPRGATMVRADTELDSSNALISGFVHRYKQLSDGRRQSMEVSIAGDFVDLHSLLMKRIDHDIGCLAPCQVAIFPHERLRELTESQPHLARVLWLSTVIDAAIHREWIVSLGVRSALQRLAHLFCELWTRLDAVGLAQDHGFDFPVTQTELADILGISSVHVNRTLRELRELGLATFRGRMVEITDWAALTRTAEFDAGYLAQHSRPR